MDDLLIEYDELMSGERTTFSDRFFGRDFTLNEKHALRVMRYAFDYYLGWSADTLEHFLSKDVMERLKLLPLIKYIHFPEEYDETKDFYYIVSLIYPSKRISLEDQVVHTYQRILDGSVVKYPKDYFIGTDGLVRAGICLQYAINHGLSFTTKNDLYYFFASEDAPKFLRKWKLQTICKQAFDSPVEYLHFSLPEKEKVHIYYEYYLWLWYQSMTTDNGRRRKISHKKLIYGPLK